MGMTIEELAVRIDQFAHDNDPYEYGDRVEDREENVRQLTEAIMKGRSSEIRDYLDGFADEADDEAAVKEAEGLINALDEFVDDDFTKGLESIPVSEEGLAQ